MNNLLFYISLISNTSYPLLYSICHVETNCKNITILDNKSNSYGPMQIKLKTAQKFEPKINAEDLSRPEINIKIGAMYLRYQLNRYNNNWCKAIAAYNAGTYKESIILTGYPTNYNYVKKVLNILNKEFEITLNCDMLFILK